MKLIFESGRPGRTGAVLPVLDVPQGCAVPPSLRRSETAALPEVSELETVRHFTNLSRMNMSVDPMKKSSGCPDSPNCIRFCCSSGTAAS